MSCQPKGNEAFFSYSCGPQSLPKAVTCIPFLYIWWIKLPQALLTCTSWSCSAHHRGSQRPWFNCRGEVLTLMNCLGRKQESRASIFALSHTILSLLIFLSQWGWLAQSDLRLLLPAHVPIRRCLHINVNKPEACSYLSVWECFQNQNSVGNAGGCFFLKSSLQNCHSTAASVQCSQTRHSRCIS